METDESKSKWSRDCKKGYKNRAYLIEFFNQLSFNCFGEHKLIDFQFADDARGGLEGWRRSSEEGYKIKAFDRRGTYIVFDVRKRDGNMSFKKTGGVNKNIFVKNLKNAIMILFDSLETSPSKYVIIPDLSKLRYTFSKDKNNATRCNFLLIDKRGNSIVPCRSIAPKIGLVDGEPGFIVELLDLIEKKGRLP